MRWLRKRRRCKDRLKRGIDPAYHGRCELREGHYSDSWDEHHLLERGLVVVRWNHKDQVRYEQS